MMKNNNKYRQKNFVEMFQGHEGRNGWNEGKYENNLKI